MREAKTPQIRVDRLEAERLAAEAAEIRGRRRWIMKVINKLF